VPLPRIVIGIATPDGSAADVEMVRDIRG
jgi:hypothetical protein